MSPSSPSPCSLLPAGSTLRSFPLIAYVYLRVLVLTVLPSCEYIKTQPGLIKEAIVCPPIIHSLTCVRTPLGCRQLEVYHLPAVAAASMHSRFESTSRRQLRSGAWHSPWPLEGGSFQCGGVGDGTVGGKSLPRSPADSLCRPPAQH